MTNSWSPAMNLRVSDVERNRAEEWLKAAYVDGRLGSVEFDQRLGQALSAQTRDQLNASLAGVPAPARPVPAPAGRYLPQTSTKNTGLAAVGHFSFFVLWIFGPLLTWALAPEGSYARKEAAKAFNFQLVSFAIMTVGGIAFSIIDVGWPMGIWGVLWFVLTIVGGVKAAQGENWTNPVMKVLPWNVLRVDRR